MDVNLYREVANPSENKEDTICLPDQEQKIIAFLKKHDGKIRAKDAKNVLNVEERRTRKVLKDLVDKQIIEKKSKGPNTFYELK